MISIPAMKLTQQDFEMRKRENQLDHARTAIEDLFFSATHQPETAKLLEFICNAHTDRLKRVYQSAERGKIIGETSVLTEAIKKIESFDCVDREDRRIKTVVSNMQVVK